MTIPKDCLSTVCIQSFSTATANACLLSSQIKVFHLELILLYNIIELKLALQYGKILATRLLSHISSFF